jgi:hypothetical protein
MTKGFPINHVPMGIRRLIIAMSFSQEYFTAMSSSRVKFDEMQPTTGGRYGQYFHDYRLTSRRHARSRQRLLILFSLDH